MNTNKKIKLDIPVIVEGKYDIIKLKSIVDGQIIKTDGFSIFKSDDNKEYIKKLAEKRGIIVLTDSDGAGLVIRNYLRSILPKEKTLRQRKDISVLRALMLIYSVICSHPLKKTIFYLTTNEKLQNSIFLKTV